MTRRRRGGLHDRRARHDAAYRQAKDENFAARAVYKLQELDQRFRLLKPHRHVLDLGCWPGSWLQYAATRVGEKGIVVGLDLKPVTVALPPWVSTFVADVEEIQPRALVERFGPFDVVVSDMAPHTVGDRHLDQWRSEELFSRALAIAKEVLRPGGHFAAKVFQGGQFPALIQEVREGFAETKPFHARATRARSREQYIVGRGRRRPGSAASSPSP